MRGQRSRWAAAGLVAVVGSALVSAGPALEGTAVGRQRTAAVPTVASATQDGRIVYDNIETEQVETINPDGSARRAVSPPDDVTFNPRWTPDGSGIIYVSNHFGDDFRVVASRADGTDLHLAVDEAAGFSDFGPVYTPDGLNVVYTRCRPDPPGGCALFEVPVAGGSAHALTAYGDRSDFDADVSPSGRRVAFTRFDFHGVIARIWVMRIDGTHAHPVTAPWLEAGRPRWTPGGAHLLVTSLYAHVGENTYRLRADGSHLRKLTHARYPHNDELADPSPSGSRIVLSDDNAYPGIIGGDLLVMRRDGSGKHTITHDGRLLDPDWGTAALLPDGASRQRFAAPRPVTRPQVGALPSRVADRVARGTVASRKTW